MLWLLTQHVLLVAVLVAIVMVVCRFARLRGATQHVLWLIVLIKLLTPPLVTWPWAMEEMAKALWASRSIPGSKTQVDRLAMNQPPYVGFVNSLADRQVSPSGTAISADRISDADGGRVAAANGADANNADRDGTAVVFLRSEVFTKVAFGLWLAGSFVAAAVCFLRTLRVRQNVMRGENPPTWLLAEVDVIVEQLNVRRPRIVVPDGLATPFVWCLWTLKLVWPRRLADDDRAADIRGILVHELAHIRRRDHWIAWLEMAARVVWWWNPLGWLILRKLRECAELACDEWVVRLLPNQRRAYAESLVDIYEQASARAMPIAAIGARAGSMRFFERRLVMIMRDHSETKWSLWTWLPLGFVLLVALPGFSWEKKQKQREKAGIQAPAARTDDVATPVAGGAVSQNEPASDADDQISPPGSSDSGPGDGQQPMPDVAIMSPRESVADLNEAEIDSDVVDEILRRVESHHFEEVDRQELLTAAVQAMLDKLGSSSAYLRQNELDSVMLAIDQSLVGAGIELRLDDGRLVVVQPIPSSPAATAGVRSGDIIEQIDGVAVEDLPKEKRLGAAVKLIRGKPGEAVTLGVRRKGSDRRESIRIVRSVITIDTVQGHRRKSDGRWQFLLDRENNIGYIRITAFDKRTARNVGAAVNDLRSCEMRGLIIDLRDCPGGLLTSAVETADLFVDEGTIVTTTSRRGTSENLVHKAQRQKTHLGFPMVVLVNGGTASAAEIVAACLQDHDRATIVGQRTYGRGIVYGIFALDSGRGAVKVATAQFYRPNGGSLHRFPNADESEDWGVKPDEEFRIVLSDAQQRQLHNDRIRRETPQVDDAAPAMSTDRQLDASLKHLRGVDLPGTENEARGSDGPVETGAGSRGI